MRKSASARHISATPSWLDSEYSWINPSTPLERVFALSLATKAAGERADAVRFVRVRGRQLKERRHALGLGRPVGGGDRAPERRLRRDLGAERGEDVGGVGHVRLPEAAPTRARPEGGRAILFSGKAFCLCRQMRSSAVTKIGLALSTVLFALAAADHYIASWGAEYEDWPCA